MVLLRDHAEKSQISPPRGIFSVATSWLNRMHISRLMRFVWYFDHYGLSDCQIKAVCVVKISPWGWILEEEGDLFPPSSGMFVWCVCVFVYLFQNPKPSEIWSLVTGTAKGSWTLPTSHHGSLVNTLIGMYFLLLRCDLAQNIRSSVLSTVKCCLYWKIPKLW